MSLWLLFFAVLISLLSPSKVSSQAQNDRQKALGALEESINIKLVDLKSKLPASYREIWAHSLPGQKFDDLQNTDIELFNKLLGLREQYEQKFKEIDGKFPDLELTALEEKHRVPLEAFYKKLETEIPKNVGPRTRERYPKEMDPKIFMQTDFSQIDYFSRNKNILDGALAVQTRMQSEWDAVKKPFEEEKAALFAARAALRQEAIARLEKSESDGSSSPNGFWDDFAIGVKGGLNFSTGSEGGSAESAPVIGMVFEYTFLRIPALAFETSIEFNFNYIQRPVTIAEGTINTDYINMPLFAKAKFPANIPLGFGKFSPFIGIGFDPYFRLSSNFVHKATQEEITYDSKGASFAFVWNLGGEFDLGPAGVFSLEFRMSLGTNAGISAYTLDMTPWGYGTLEIPEQRQNGYMIFIGWKVAPGTWF